MGVKDRIGDKIGDRKGEWSWERVRSLTNISLSSGMLLLLIIAVVSAAIALTFYLAHIHIGISPAEVSVEVANIELTGLKSGEHFTAISTSNVTAKNIANPYIVIYVANLSSTELEAFDSLNLGIDIDGVHATDIDLKLNPNTSYAQSVFEGTHTVKLNLSGDVGLVTEQTDVYFDVMIDVKTAAKPGSVTVTGSIIGRIVGG